VRSCYASLAVLTFVQMHQLFSDCWLLRVGLLACSIFCFIEVVNFFKYSKSTVIVIFIFFNYLTPRINAY